MMGSCNIARFWIAALLAASPLAAHADEARGRVFLDANANGRRDANEMGVAGVKVSNGRQIALTDADGRYRIAIENGDTLFIVKPAEIAVPFDARGLPQFYRHHFPKGAPAQKQAALKQVALKQAALKQDAMPRSDARRVDFALLREAEAQASFDVLALTDTQVNDAREVGYLNRQIVDPILRQPQAHLAVVMGDIVNDQPSQYPALIAVLTRVKLPWLIAPGNHDVDLDAASEIDTTLSFRRHFGPDSYAWEEPGTAFVVLDDVIFTPLQKQRYVGGLREDQFQFLEAYFATLPSSTRVVLAFHIPLFQIGPETFREADRLRLFALLQRFHDPLILSGHTHAQRHHYYGTNEGWHGEMPLHEYNVGAACGGYWGGLTDDDGQPDARMEDGTPNGFARLHLAPEKITTRYFASRGRDELRIGLTSPGTLRRFSYPAYSAYANLYNGDTQAVVWYRIDEGDWQLMARIDAADPELVALNLEDMRTPSLRSRNRAVGAGLSPHLWHVRVPTTLSEGEHVLEVRAISQSEGEVRARTTYTLQTWPE